MTTGVQYLDLHIDLEALPENRLDGVRPILNPNAEVFAKEFILKLQQYLREGKSHELFMLYEVEYQAAIYSQNHFQGDRKWPEPQEIEEKFDVEVNLTTQYIYNELIRRPQFKSLPKEREGSIGDLAEVSWENYLSIFENVAQRGQKQIALPAGWIWDIFDEFAYQFYTVCSRRIDSTLDKTIWLPNKIRAMLNNLYSPLLVDGKLVLSKEPDTRELFGYYALICEFRILTHLGKYEDGLSLIQVISLDHTLIFSKAIGSQMNLFFHASFCYFMHEKYLQAAKLAETIAIFYDNYSKFFSKSLSNRTNTRLFERILALWCLTHVFEGSDAPLTIIELIRSTGIKTKDRTYKESLYDKLEKLKQFDDNTFNELVNFGLPRYVNEKTLCSEFYNNLYSRYSSLKKINFNTILKFYSRIEVGKAARFLKTTEEEVVNRIESYGKRKIELQEGKVWDRTILKPLLRIAGEDNVRIEDGVIIVEKEAEKRHTTNYNNLVNTVQDITFKINRL